MPKKKPTEPLTVSQADAARLVSVTDRTIREWERKKLIKGERVNGGKKMYPLAKLKKLAGVA
jgi:DNA-binding transcriptional MerR regulator